MTSWTVNRSYTDERCLLTSHFKIDFILSLSREVASLSFLAPFPSGGGGHLVQMLHTILERYIARARVI